jgi:hypothetical protein
MQLIDSGLCGFEIFEVRRQDAGWSILNLDHDSLLWWDSSNTADPLHLALRSFVASQLSDTQKHCLADVVLQPRGIVRDWLHGKVGTLPGKNSAKYSDTSNDDLRPPLGSLPASATPLSI